VNHCSGALSSGAHKAQLAQQEKAGTGRARSPLARVITPACPADRPGRPGWWATMIGRSPRIMVGSRPVRPGLPRDRRQLPRISNLVHQVAAHHVAIADRLAPQGRPTGGGGGIGGGKKKKKGGDQFRIEVHGRKRSFSRSNGLAHPAGPRANRVAPFTRICDPRSARPGRPNLIRAGLQG